MGYTCWLTRERMKANRLKMIVVVGGVVVGVVVVVVVVVLVLVIVVVVVVVVGVHPNARHRVRCVGRFLWGMRRPLDDMLRRNTAHTSH